jgi:sugar O-acyltransferase (sialic acid O-acetyltransferase NeuD family)
MKNVLIFGIGGHAKVLVDIIEKQEKYNIAGFINQNYEQNKFEMGYRVLGDELSLKKIISKYEIYGGIIGIGDNSIRASVKEKVHMLIPNFKFVNCIHPNSSLGKDVILGEGNVLMAGTIINSSSRVKNHCILNTNSSIDHDCLMSNYSSIAPNVTVGGNVQIGDYSAIGIGSNILHNVTIGENCIIGGGSLVCNDTDRNSVYYGSPSKYIRKHKLGDSYLK